MKRTNVTYLLLGLITMLVVGVGCQETFTGEWVEDGIAGPHGWEPSPTGGRREALQFDGISTVRIGALSGWAKVVDNQTVQSDQYFVFDAGRSAQFGALVARFEDGKMVVASADGTTKRVFVRQNGASIFPPYIQLPRLTRSDLHRMEYYALAEVSLKSQPWSSPLL